MHADDEWSYIRSEFNPIDFHYKTNSEELLVAYSSLLIVYSISKENLEQNINAYQETMSLDLKEAFNINKVKKIEVDIFDNIWIVNQYSDIFILDSDYNLVKEFSYLDVDHIGDCINYDREDQSYIACIYNLENDLGLLSFRYDEDRIPEYLDYYYITSINNQSSFISDLEHLNNYIYICTDSGIFKGDLNYNLKLPDSWSLTENSTDVLDIFTDSNTLYSINYVDENSVSILDGSQNLIKEININSSDFVSVYAANQFMSMHLKNKIINYVIEYNSESDIEVLELNSTLETESANYTLMKLYIDSSLDKPIIAASNKNRGVSLYYAGCIDLDYLCSGFTILSESSAIDAYNAITLLDNGDIVAAGIINENSLYYSSILHYDGINYSNYAPLNKIEYFDDSVIGVDFISGIDLPVSIAEFQSNKVIFSNSGVQQGSQNQGGVIALDLETQSLIDVYNSENTGTLGGLDGIYEESWDNNRLSINQLKEYGNQIWVVNPYNEYFGNILSVYDYDSGIWNGKSLGNSSLYLPQEIAFDRLGRPWVSFNYERTLASDSYYSNGGVRYLNYNNQFVEPLNSDLLVDGSQSDVWSIDICDSDGYDILWVLSSGGVNGYTIIDNALNPISSFSFFSELQFSKGDHVRCDQFSNVWVTTRHSGVRTILSESNYQEYWPSYIGMSSENSGLLSDIVYDIAFDGGSEQVLFATELGICILSSPFYNVPLDENNGYSLSLDKNPFLVPKDNLLTIGNVPIGSTIRIMNLRGYTFETLSGSGTNEYKWDGTDKYGRFLASGVYLIISSNKDSKTSIAKLAIIRENN